MPIGFESDGPVLDGSGEPVRQPRRGGGPPGGGGGGGGNGGFGGLNGLNPRIFQGLNSFGGDIPMVVRKRGMPGMNPGPPGRGDTVPAMLTPGEQVMSNQAQETNPELAQQVLMANMQSANGYADGGVVPEQEYGTGRPSRAIRILRLLLELDDDAEGFAFGGIAGMKPQGGGFPGGFGGAFGGGPAGGGFGGGGGGGFPGMGASNPAGKGGQAPTGGAAGSQPASGGYTYNDKGGVTGGYNPANPWGHLTQNKDTGIYGSWARQMGNAGAAGVYDPRGNQALISGMNEAAQGTADSLVRRDMAQADLGGMDPAQRAVAKLQSLRDSGRGVQDIMARTRADALGSADQFYKDMAGRMVNADTGFIGSDNAAQQQRNTDRANRPSALGQLGGIAGQLGGAYLSGGGSLIPKKPKP